MSLYIPYLDAPRSWDTFYRPSRQNSVAAKAAGVIVTILLISLYYVLSSGKVQVGDVSVSAPGALGPTQVMKDKLTGWAIGYREQRSVIHSTAGESRHPAWATKRSDKKKRATTARIATRYRNSGPSESA